MLGKGVRIWRPTLKRSRPRVAFPGRKNDSPLPRFILSALVNIPNLTVVSFSHAGARPPRSPSQDLGLSWTRDPMQSAPHADTPSRPPSNGIHSFTLLRCCSYLAAAIDFKSTTFRREGARAVCAPVTKCSEERGRTLRGVRRRVYYNVTAR